MKIFISSTYEDLKDYRQAAIEVVNKYKCVPLAMEFFDSQPGEPEKVCEKEIQEKRFEKGTTEEDEWEKRQRELVHPSAARFLAHLASSTGKTKTIITRCY